MEGRRLKVTALVPAHGGSKGIPRKNIKPMAGRPLLYWVLDALSGCDAIDETLVATDDNDIRTAVAAYHHPRVRCIDRSAESATDEATTEALLLEVASAIDTDVIVLAQATSPLLQTRDVEQALRLLAAPDVDSVVSVVRQHRFRWSPVGGLVEPVNYNPSSRPRRQDFQGDLVENGALYASGRTAILSSGVRVSGRVAAVEMPADSYLEVDEPSDWPLIEAALWTRSHAERSPLSTIRAVFCDVDGVLTDSGMYYSPSGDLMKKFNTRDGVGFEMLRTAGFVTGLITGESSAVVEQRAAKLRLHFVEMGAVDKLSVGTVIAKKYGLDMSEIAFVGDDIGDLPLLRAVGFAAAPADAIPAVLDTAHYVCAARGGSGVIREVAETLLMTRS